MDSDLHKVPLTLDLPAAYGNYFLKNMTSTIKNLTDQLTITLCIRRSTANGISVQDHANGWSQTF